jgi:pyruvate/2-oxoglutarate dehydrogenase complex dihydrolipoamide dehydrogenase (E3) component
MDKVSQSKRVSIIGGGPAGLEAARVAAIRGHIVDLYEKENELGGNLRASTSPYKTQLKKLLNYYRIQLGKLGVRVHLNCQVDPASLLEDIAADRVIVATGAKPVVPNVPGIGNPHVMSVQQAYLWRREELGQTLVIVGGERVACDAAIEFAGEGRRVTMITESPTVAVTSSLDDREMLKKRLAERRVEIVVDHRLLRFTDDAALIQGPDGERTVAADTLLYDFGRTPDRMLTEAFAYSHAEVTAIGDCEKVGVIGEAIRRGFFTAWGIR